MWLTLADLPRNARGEGKVVTYVELSRLALKKTHIVGLFVLGEYPSVRNYASSAKYLIVRTIWLV